MKSTGRRPTVVLTFMIASKAVGRVTARTRSDCSSGASLSGLKYLKHLFKTSFSKSRSQTHRVLVQCATGQMTDVCHRGNIRKLRGTDKQLDWGRCPHHFLANCLIDFVARLEQELLLFWALTVFGFKYIFCSMNKPMSLRSSRLASLPGALADGSDEWNMKSLPARLALVNAWAAAWTTGIKHASGVGCVYNWEVDFNFSIYLCQTCGIWVNSVSIFSLHSSGSTMKPVCKGTKMSSTSPTTWTFGQTRFKCRLNSPSSAAERVPWQGWRRRLCGHRWGSRHALASAHPRPAANCQARWE